MLLLRRPEGTYDTQASIHAILPLVIFGIQYNSMLYDRYESYVNWAEVRFDTAAQLEMDNAQI